MRAKRTFNIVSGEIPDGTGKWYIIGTCQMDPDKARALNTRNINIGLNIRYEAADPDLSKGLAMMNDLVGMFGGSQP